MASPFGEQNSVTPRRREGKREATDSIKGKRWGGPVTAFGMRDSESGGFGAFFSVGFGVTSAERRGGCARYGYVERAS